MNILAACTRPGLARAQVRLQVVHALLRLPSRTTRPSSTRRCGRPHPPRTRIERDIVEAEASLNEFAEHEPGRRGDASCASRTCSARTCETSHIELFSLPVVPMILGFDPRYQFVHEDDVVHALEHAVKQRVPGHLQRGRATACSRSARWPACSASPTRPSCRRGAPGSRRRCCGGSGVDDPAGDARADALRPRRGQPPLQGGRLPLPHTSRETVMKLGEHLRLHPVVRGAQEPYRYEREVEDFLRWSPHVKNTRDKEASEPEPRPARRAAAAAARASRRRPGWT